MIIFYFFGRIWHHFNRFLGPKIPWIMALPYDTQNCHAPQWESSNKTWQTRAMSTGPRSGIHPSPIDVYTLTWPSPFGKQYCLPNGEGQVCYAWLVYASGTISFFFFFFWTRKHIKYSLRFGYSGPQSHKPAWINEPIMDFSQFVRINFPCISALILEALRTLFLVENY